jgi:DNA-binding transcriptional LysR family regulator
MGDPGDIDPRLLQVFAAVVRSGSITRAAARLGLSKSVVSRRLVQLEQLLGAQLLRRSTRQMTPTELGALVARQAEAVEAATAGVRELVQGHHGEARGRLRVACSAALGQLYVLPMCMELAAEHPALDITLHLEERFVDVVGEGFDIALRFADLADSSLISLKLADVRRVVAASPAYLEQHRVPEHPDDLADHDCVLFCNGERVYDEWLFTGLDGADHRVRVRGQLRLNAGIPMVRAALNGAGIVCIDRFIIRAEIERGELVPLLPRYPPAMGFSLYALHAGRERVPRKTRIFLERLQTRLRALGGGSPPTGPVLI